MIDIQTFLGKAAPWLAAAAAGPAGLAMQALRTAADAIGADSSSPDAIAGALAGATPEKLEALRRAELEFKVRMQSLGFENLAAMESLAVADRKDARAMQIAVRSHVPALLAVLVTLGFFGVLLGMLSGALTVSDNQALLILLGALSAAWGGVINYYFGSSAGSARKDEIAAHRAG